MRVFYSNTMYIYTVQYQTGKPGILLMKCHSNQSMIALCGVRQYY